MNPTKLKADCIIMAAGLSSRMGDWKMMLPFGNGTLLDVAIANALAVCQRVLLVGGYRYAELEARYQADPAITLINNPHYSDGLLNSVKVGVSHVQTDYFFIAHGDMPCLYPKFYRQLWQHLGYRAVFLGTDELPGHPVLLSHTIIPYVLRAAPSDTMYQVITRAGNIHYIGLTDDAIVCDVDTRAAYEALLADDKLA